MLDNYNRKINYIRVSVTDRCNLRCIYCRPAKHFHQLDRSQILSFEEIIRLIKIAVLNGITKVRLTGGDPLVRKDIVKLIKSISQLDGISDLSLTTNGILLSQMAHKLYDAGLRRINISLDSLKKSKFEDITGLDGLKQVLKGIEAVKQIGFAPIKINVVIIKGINDDEILDLAKLSLDNSFHIRFIEFMPVGNNQLWQKKRYMSCSIIKEIICSYKPLMASSLSGPHHSPSNGPARLFEFKGAPGKIGFISPMSNHFCSTCNRIRLTADGKMRSCLLSNAEIDIKSALNSGATNEELQKLFIFAIKNKPGKHNIFQKPPKAFNRNMTSIGG